MSPQKKLSHPAAVCHTLVDSAEELIYALDRQGCFTFLNPAMASFFSEEASEIIGKPISDFLPQPDVQEQMKSVEMIFAGVKSIKTEFSIRKGGRIFLFGANLMPLKNKRESIYGVLGVARDMTEARNLEKQLISTEKLASLGTLAAGVAHEINNPLAIILGFCDLLLEKTDPDSLIHRDLKTIERHGLYCKKVVESLLSFARITEEDEDSTDINHALEMVLGVVNHTLFVNSITLEKDFASSLPLARGDAKQFQQVFLSVISNAIDAMKNGGVLGISTGLEEASDFVLVRITDTGIGIEKKYMDKIFDPFFTTKPDGEGTGLGLSVSYGIVTKYGGSISCESRIPEFPGAVFAVRLPVFRGE
ncbi:MAG: ATP-binding protein [Pseudomonadota bacterium]